MSSATLSYVQFRAHQKTFTSKEGNLKFIDQGEGKVILLLHGIPTSGWLYRKMIDLISEKGYRVIAPDMLGFGNSDSPNGYEIYSEDNHAQRILDLMDALQIDNWMHVMHDAGGLWTWELFKKQPDRISKLIILNTIILEKGFVPPIRLKRGVLAQIIMWCYRNGITTNTLLKGLFKSGLTQNTLSKDEIEGYKKPLLEGKTKGMYYFFTQTCENLPDYSEVLKNLSIPVAVIWGKNDSFLKWEPQKERVISDPKISEENIHLLDAKHFIQEEKPEEISQLILNFIA